MTHKLRLTMGAAVVAAAMATAACSANSDDSAAGQPQSPSAAPTTTTDSPAGPSLNIPADIGGKHNGGSTADDPQEPLPAAETTDLYIPGGNMWSTTQDGVEVKTVIPHVAVGDGNNDAAVAFSEAMSKSIHDVVDQAAHDISAHPDVTGSVVDGGIRNDEKSRVVTATQDVLAGVRIVDVNTGGAHPFASVGTIVINAKTAEPILTSDVFTDTKAAIAKLQSLTPLDDLGGFPSDDITGDEIDNWVPSAAGLTVYWSVNHAAGDWAPYTYSWDQVRDLIPADVFTILTAS